MKVALVHELLTMRGGAERVLRVVANIFPDAPIYTLLYDEHKLGTWFPKHRIHSSFLQKPANRLPLAAYRFNHHLYLPYFPEAAERWDFSEYDLVLSFSSAFAHGIITNSHPRHLCYVHSPARYLWDRTHDVLLRSGKGFLGPLRQLYLSLLFHRLRIWDTEAADRPDHLLSASKTVQRRVELYWRRESDVLYPPIDDFWFTEASLLPLTTNRPYYLIASTLAPYKRIDLAIEACNELKKHLVIAGEGPARAQLESIAGPTIEFVGYKEGEELRSLYSNAEATIFPGEEDFGLVPIESLSCGTPVIAYAQGGALETVQEGKTGTFFLSPTAASIAKAITRFEGMTFDKDVCKHSAKPFGREPFEKKLRAFITSVLS
jgi:glycosyltransferase involved in cell wall biosynthesis